MRVVNPETGKECTINPRQLKAFENAGWERADGGPAPAPVIEGVVEAEATEEDEAVGEDSEVEADED